MDSATEHELASSRAGQMYLAAGELSLDFANTADWHAGPAPTEFLNSYADLVAWARHAGLIGDLEAGRLLNSAAGRPQAASAALERAVMLREVLYRVFCSVAHGVGPAPADVAALNLYLNDAFNHLGITPDARPDGGTAFGWVWGEPMDRLDAVLWPIVRSAADLLTSPRLDRVRQCEGDPCGWLFLDSSRNRSRRWCSMEDCGNRAKARRHYARTRGSAEPPAE